MEAVGALYLHIPFCVRRCRYCDFSTAATAHADPLIGAYVEALGSLIARLAAAGLLAGVRTAYIGGGTPTMAGDALPGLVGTVRAACPGIGEVSCEANPESLTPRLARGLAATGATRVSLGVQSLDDGELAVLGRAHAAEQALAAARAVVRAGLDLSCDLMCGIPLQDGASWRRSLEGVLEAGAGHVSCYPLMLEEGTPLEAAVSRGELAEPDDDAQADRMEEAAELLRAAGLSRYEVASYARPSKECAHNVAYWTGVPYLGLGSSAASMLGPDGFAALAEALPLSCRVEDDETLEDALGMRGRLGVTDGRGLAQRIGEAGVPRAARVRLRMVDGACDLVGKLGRGEPLLVEVETLTAREAAAEDLMLGMRMTAGVGASLLRRAVQDGVPAAELDRVWASLESDGLVVRDGAGGYQPTRDGWLRGNLLYGALWDLAQDR